MMQEKTHNCNCQSTENRQELGNHKPDCCVEEVGAMVQKLVRVFQLFERDQTKVHGFTTSQCYVLIELFKLGSLTMNELSERMNLNTSTMTRVVDNLVRDKYVCRDRDESDRRIVIVTLTDKGRGITVKLNNTVTDYYRKIIANIPEGQVEEILKAVEILLGAFEKANPNCC
jgi:MarR family transcriptional regulator, organic hydroperoxide resistance regulator